MQWSGWLATMPANDMREDLSGLKSKSARRENFSLMTLAHADALISAAFAPAVQRGEEVEVIRLDGRGENL
jgi:hypothetical protein